MRAINTISFGFYRAHIFYCNRSCFCCTFFYGFYSVVNMLFVCCAAYLSFIFVLQLSGNNKDDSWQKHQARSNRTRKIMQMSNNNHSTDSINLQQIRNYPRSHSHTVTGSCILAFALMGVCRSRALPAALL